LDNQGFDDREILKGIRDILIQGKAGKVEEGAS
jgi:hypothetical protein